MSDDSLNWIDEELRRVPLPAGLLARLRRAGRLSDDDVDLVLRSVTTPSGLLGRLAAIVEDEQLDRQLGDVPVPEGLLAALEFIPQDEQLRQVVVPADLLLELRRIPPRRRSRIPAGRFALAASLLLMITAGYALSIGGLVMSAYDRNPQRYAIFTLDDPPVELVGDASADEALAIEFPAANVSRQTPVWPVVEVRDAGPAHVDTRPILVALQEDFLGDYSLSDSTLPFAYGLLGHAQSTEDNLPDLELVGGPEARGVEPPMVAGFDRQFLITKRTNPIVALASAPGRDDDTERAALLDALRRSELPLWTETTSFDRLWVESAAGRRPSPHEIHVEDFLAAMDFRYSPARPGELAIRAFAGPSAFGENYAQLMQVGVQAGVVEDNQPPLHTTLAVDISDSMKFGGRLDAVRQAVGRFARLLRPQDRFSLIVYNEQAYVIFQDVAGEERGLLAQALARLSPDGGTNFVAGLQQAAEAALSPVAEAFPRRRVVVLCDGIPSLPQETANGLARLTDDLREDNVSVQVIAVDGARPLPLKSDDPATIAGQAIVHCESGEALYQRLASRVAAVSPTVATDATLTVNFNPAVVRQYRLLGHEATTGGGMLSADVESTMLAGQAATVLYELWLEPSGPSLVAEVTTQWTDAHGRRRTTRQEIHRRQFRTSWREAALPLQAATIAAEAAEVLRESAYCGTRNRDLKDVLDAAAEVNPRLAEREAFQQYVRVLRQADAARRGVSATVPTGGGRRGG